MHCYCCCGIRLFDSEALWQLMNRAHSFSRTTLPNSVGQFAKFSSSPWQNRPYFAACRNRTFGSKLISILLKKLPLLKAGIVLIYAGLWVEENCQFFLSAVCQVALCLFTIVPHCNSYYSIHSVPKKHSRHFQLSLENQLPDFDNFWYEYSWYNLPSNDDSFFHLTQRLFLNYLGKTQPAKYHFLSNEIWLLN